MLHLLVAVAFPSLASAQDCDAQALAAEVAEATPMSAARAYVQLAACDAGVAKEVAAETLPRLLAGDEANQAAVAAIKAGAPDAVVSWMDGLQADERSRAIRGLGEECNESVELQSFFVDRAAKLGEKFWSDRWYRALTTCRQASVQAILSAEIDKGMGVDRTRYFSVLETYARSAGPDALARLTTIAKDIDDAEAEVNVVSAFADAARVGTPDGADAATAAAASAAIKGIAGDLTKKGVEQARMTLLALGDEQGSDDLVAVRYKEADQGGGNFLWGAIAEEKATCKNGKLMQRVHVASVTERGNTWPDQLLEKVEAAAEVNWELNLAAKCKGTGETSWHVSPTPFASESEFQTWADKMTDERKDDAAKFVRLDVEPLQI
jgi:hypothetical protein